MRSNAEISEYIKTFIGNCVFANKQERVRLKLLPIENNKWSEIALKLHTYLDFKACKDLSSTERMPENLQTKYGNQAGIYLDFVSAPKSMTLTDAAAQHFKDALFVLKEGNLVFFFTHNDDVYVCTKPA